MRFFSYPHGCVRPRRFTFRPGIRRLSHPAGKRVLLSGDLAYQNLPAGIGRHRAVLRTKCFPPPFMARIFESDGGSVSRGEIQSLEIDFARDACSTAKVNASSKSPAIGPSSLTLSHVCFKSAGSFAKAYRFQAVLDVRRRVPIRWPLSLRFKVLKGDAHVQCYPATRRLGPRRAEISRPHVAGLRAPGRELIPDVKTAATISIRPTKCPGASTI